MSKYCKYIIIKDNELKILKTKRMTDLVKRELGVFDYRDYLFGRRSFNLSSCKGFKHL